MRRSHTGRAMLMGPNLMDGVEEESWGKSQREKYEFSLSMLILLPPKQRDGATLIAGGRLWFDAIDYPAHWGLQSVASCEQKCLLGGNKLMLIAHFSKD